MLPFFDRGGDSVVHDEFFLDFTFVQVRGGDVGEVFFVAAGDLLRGAAADGNGGECRWIVVGEDPADGEAVIKQGGGSGNSGLGALATHDHCD